MLEETCSPLEAKLCEECGRIHVGDQCGTDIIDDGDPFILEFEQLSSDEHVQKLRKTIQQLRDDRWMATSKAEKFRRRLLKINKDLPHMKEEIARQKFAVSKLRNVAQLNQRQVQDEFRIVCSTFSEMCARLAANMNCDGSCAGLRTNHQKLQAVHDKLIASEQALTARVAQLEAQLVLTAREAETVNLHARNKDLNSDQKLTKLQKDLAQREAELKTLKKDYLVCQRRVEEEAERVTEAQLRASKQLSECERIKSLLKHSQDEAHKLTQDRDEMVEKIEELKALVSQREQEIKKIKSGVKDNVDAEMLRLMKEMDDYQVKDNVDAEMLRLMKEMDDYQALMKKRVSEESEKEKDRIRKELEEYVTEYRANQSKLMDKMKTQTQQHREAMGRLQQELEEARENAAMRERDLQVQLRQLQAHRANAGSKTTTPLPHATGDMSDLLREKDTEIRTLTNQIQFLKDKINELELYIDTRGSEPRDKRVEMLEGLVQREVEERQQLMQQFSQAREELHRLKQAANTGGTTGGGKADMSTLENLLTVDEEKRPKPKNMSALESITIYKKRSENRYGGFSYKPSESVAMDLADFQTVGGSTHYPKSNYGSEYFADSELTKSAKTERTKTGKSAKSMKSLRSLHSNYDRDLLNEQLIKDRELLQELDKVYNRTYQWNEQGEGDLKDGEEKLGFLPPKPAPPEFKKPDKPHALEPRNQMPFQSPLGLLQNVDNTPKSVTQGTLSVKSKDTRSKHNEEHSKHNEERSKHNEERSKHSEERSKHNEERSKHSEERSKSNEERSKHSEERIQHKDEPRDVMFEAVDSLSPDKNSDKLPQWAKAIHQNAGRYRLPLNSSLVNKDSPNFSRPKASKPGADTSTNDDASMLYRFTAQELDHRSPSVVQTGAMNNSRAGGLSLMVRSDGLLDTSRSGPPAASNPAAVAASAKAAAMQRLSMMKTVNQAGIKRSSNSAWKIYQSLKVSKQP